MICIISSCIYIYMIVSKRYCLVTLTTPMIPWMMHPLKSNRWIHLEGLTSGWICKASRPRRHLKWLHWNYWAGFSLVVSAQLKNISQNGNLPQIEVKIKNMRNHHLVIELVCLGCLIGRFQLNDGLIGRFQLNDGLTGRCQPLKHYWIPWIHYYQTPTFHWILVG